MVRNHTPILVRQPQEDPRIHTELAAASRSNSYVAAPVYAWQQPIALLHADAPANPGGVAPHDRDLIGLLAEGIGVIFERNLMLERLQAMRVLVRGHARDIWSMSGPLEAPYLPGLGYDVEAGQGFDADLSTLLTLRECQVLDLLAVGNTNAQIAAQLLVTQNTVKSHVSHILRKLRAGNRTEAVSIYQRLLMRPPWTRP